MGGNETMFGVNFVDGRIKGYPTFKLFEVKVVRGGDNYGENDFQDNNDGTITDRATGLMWGQAGSSAGMNWEDALAWAQARNAETYLGYDDWRLPNAKELQSIVDYDRSPSFTQSPAISPLFNVPAIVDEGGNDNYPFYWTSTTHNDGPRPDKAVYVCFGEALGYMNGRWMDVHGAGAQRSDPKTGDPADYPRGRGPQGDAIRILNYVRLVRDAVPDSSGAPTGRSDFDGDGQIDFDDFVLFAMGYGKHEGQPDYEVAYDFDASGDIGFPDYLIFARSYGKQPAQGSAGPQISRPQMSPSVSAALWTPPRGHHWRVRNAALRACRSEGRCVWRQSFG
jgi:hypothetical protein